MIVRVPLTITLDGSVDIMLDDGETLESLNSEEIIERAINALEDDYEHYESIAEMTDTYVDINGAYVIDDDEDSEEDEDDEDFE